MQQSPWVVRIDPVDAHVQHAGHRCLIVDGPRPGLQTRLMDLLGGVSDKMSSSGHSELHETLKQKVFRRDGSLVHGLKEEINERLEKVGKAFGVPDLYDKIADETVGVTEEEILPWLEEKGHPALSMDPIIG